LNADNMVGGVGLLQLAAHKDAQTATAPWRTVTYTVPRIAHRFIKAKARKGQLVKFCLKKRE